MMVTTPPPAAAPKPAPAPPASSTAPAAPAPPGPAAPAQTGSAPNGPSAPGAPAPSTPEGAPKDATKVPTKEEAIAQTMAMSAQDAAAAVAQNFDALGKLTVGGGTKEGAEHAKVASMLLANSSNMVQLAHHKAAEHLRSLADELDVRMMAAATELAYLGGQVSLAGGSKEPVKVADIAAAPIAATSAALADIVEAVAPKPAAPDAPAPSSDTLNPGTGPKPDAPAAPKPDAASVPVPAAQNGNTGVAGGVAPPKNLQHVTPGPGAGRGPNPA